MGPHRAMRAQRATEQATATREGRTWSMRARPMADLVRSRRVARRPLHSSNHLLWTLASRSVSSTRSPPRPSCAGPEDAGPRAEGGPDVDASGSEASSRDDASPGEDASPKDGGQGRRLGHVRGGWRLTPAEFLAPHLDAVMTRPSIVPLGLVLDPKSVQ